MATRTVYEVLPDGADWVVKRRGASQAARRFKDKDNAVSYGQRVAKNNRPSQLVIHKQDGTYQRDYTYNSDPYPPKG